MQSTKKISFLTPRKKKEKLKKDQSLLIPWNEVFETSIEAIDQQHQELVFKYNTLVESVINGNEDRNEIGFLLDDLIDYTNLHFTTEERIQKLLNFPEYKRHCGIHKKFVNQVLKYQDQFNHGANLSTELISTLKKWLGDHILKDDMKIGSYFKRNKEKYQKKMQKFHKFYFNSLNSSKRSKRTHVLSSSLYLKPQKKHKNSKISFFLQFWNIGTLIFLVFSIIFTFLFTIIFFLFTNPSLVSFFQTYYYITLLLFTIILISSQILIFIISYFIHFIVSQTLKILSYEMDRICNLNLNKKSKIQNLNKLKLNEFANLDYTFRKFLVGIENFLKFTPLTIMAQLLRNNEAVALGTKKKMCTYVFSDIESFTTISESLCSDDLVLLLERFFKVSDIAVHNHQGIILQYLGDGLMVSFNASKYVSRHPLKAVLCCLEILEELETINTIGDLPAIKLRLGINTDYAHVGIVGGNFRMFYSAIGGAINEASRLEALNKQYGSRIMCSDKTMKLIKNEKKAKNFSIRWLDQVQLSGKHENSHVYEIKKKKIEENDEIYGNFKETNAVRDLNYDKICQLSLQIKTIFDDEREKDDENKVGEVVRLLKIIQNLNPKDVPCFRLMKRINETQSLAVFHQKKDHRIEKRKNPANYDDIEFENIGIFDEENLKKYNTTINNY